MGPSVWGGAQVCGAGPKCVGQGPGIYYVATMGFHPSDFLPSHTPLHYPFTNTYTHPLPPYSETHTQRHTLIFASTLPVTCTHTRFHIHTYTHTHTHTHSSVCLSIPSSVLPHHSGSHFKRTTLSLVTKMHPHHSIHTHIHLYTYRHTLVSPHKHTPQSLHTHTHHTPKTFTPSLLPIYLVSSCKHQSLPTCLPHTTLFSLLTPPFSSSTHTTTPL